MFAEIVLIRMDEQILQVFQKMELLEYLKLPEILINQTSYN